MCMGRFNLGSMIMKYPSFIHSFIHPTNTHWVSLMCLVLVAEGITMNNKDKTFLPKSHFNGVNQIIINEIILGS